MSVTTGVSGQRRLEVDTDLKCGDCGCERCGTLFERLLALEFERAEPYGRLHGITVAAYGVQHPSRFSLHIREAQWALLHAFTTEGIAGAERVQLRRRRENSHLCGSHDPRVDAAVVPLPTHVPVDFTICGVAGPDGDFPRERHTERVEAWVASLFAGG